MLRNIGRFTRVQLFHGRRGSQQQPKVDQPGWLNPNPDPNPKPSPNPNPSPYPKRNPGVESSRSDVTTSARPTCLTGPLALWLKPMHNSCGTFFCFWCIQMSVFREVADILQAQPPSPPVEKLCPIHPAWQFYFKAT